MKKIILLFNFIISTLFADQLIVSTNKCDQNITHHRLFICYNYKTKVANYITYYATANEVAQSAKRLYFKEDTSIPEEYRAYLTDYYNSGYDRFHIAPDNIMDFNHTFLADTYLLSNIAPGDSYVNRYRWTIIERDETFFYIEHNESTSFSITGTIFPVQGNFKTIGEHKIGVPEYFYKCFFSRSTNPLLIYDYKCYLMPNKKALVYPYKNLKYYQVSLELIKMLTGLTIRFEVGE